MMRLRILMMLCLIGLCAEPALASDSIKPFMADSMQSILASRQGKPFILGLWSLSCTHCRDDLALLSNLSQQHPELEVVLIAADSLEQSREARLTLAQYHFSRTEKWIFADDFIEPLRYSIDRRWRGELPRTYFYDADHTMQAISGKLDATMVQRWITQQNIQ
jgi:thiol-disulfide isomerase/thioredoxin